MATTTEIPDRIFALTFDDRLRGRRLLAVSTRQDDPKFRSISPGYCNIDGGDIEVVELTPPGSISTLLEKFGDRIEFGFAEYPISDVTCFIDGQPHRITTDETGVPQWTWTKEERDYLFAWAVLSGQTTLR